MYVSPLSLLRRWRPPAQQREQHDVVNGDADGDDSGDGGQGEHGNI